jgi:hypothetical protein
MYRTVQNILRGLVCNSSRDVITAEWIAGELVKRAAKRGIVLDGPMALEMASR